MFFKRIRIIFSLSRKIILQLYIKEYGMVYVIEPKNGEIIPVIAYESWDNVPLPVKNKLVKLLKSEELK